MALSLVTRAERGWAVVSPAGDIDVVTPAELREHLAGVCAAEAGVIVDLTRVDFVDSAGFGVLVGALKRARARGGTLQLVCTDRRIRDVLNRDGPDEGAPDPPHAGRRGRQVARTARRASARRIAVPGTTIAEGIGGMRNPG